MKLIWKQLIHSLTVGLMLPGLLFSASGNEGQAPSESPEETVVSPQEDPAAAPVWIPVLKRDGRIVAMELEDYICRVVLGEMPASFDVEALKAQAVAARTYTLQCVEDGDRHSGAVCTDHRCCQTYMEPEDYIGYRGTEKDVDKVFDAVTQTAGQVLTYDGELICATYFASAGGVTEDAREVWGQAYPYLVSVDSPEKSVYDGEQVRVSAAEFQELLAVRLSGTPRSWFGAVTYTVGEGVDSMWIGDERYSGVELRSIFGLRSTVFTVSADDEGVTFETVGYGHRVGLSQHGADAMADEGNDYQQILAHYYRGAELQAYDSD